MAIMPEETIEKRTRKYPTDSVVFRIATKKHMLEYPELVYKVFHENTQVYELPHNVLSDFRILSFSDKTHRYKFNNRGLKSLEAKLIRDKDATFIELAHGQNPESYISPNPTTAFIRWDLDKPRSINWSEPYEISSFDTLYSCLRIEQFVALKDKQKVIDFFIQACSAMDAVYAYIDLGSFGATSKFSGVFRIDDYKATLALVNETYVRGWFWGNLLSEQHIEKLGGIDAIMNQAPFEIVKPVTTSSGRQLVYLQLSEDLLKQTEADIEKAEKYLRPLFYPKKVIFEIMPNGGLVFASRKGYVPPEAEFYTTEEMDKITGLTQEERDRWDAEATEVWQQSLANRGANKPVAISPEVEELMEKINTMIMGKIDGWVGESTADYFDQDAMEELLKELEQKAEDALNEELAKHDSEVFSTENKADMLGRALGYAEHSIYF